MSEEIEVQLKGIHNSSTDDYYAVPPMALHGRRKIFTNEKEITAGNIIKVLNKALNTHSLNRTEEVYLEKYVRGIQPIIDRKKVYNGAINNKIVVNVANQIVAFKTAEFAGKPIQYISRGNRKSALKKVEKLNSMMLSEGKHTKDMELARWMFTCGVGYRLIRNDKALAVAKKELFDEAPFEIYILDPRNTFVIRANDVTQRILAGVTFVFLDELNNEVEFTVYTDNQVFTIRGTVLRAREITNVVTHNSGYVPLLEYPCNSVYMSPVEVVHDLLNCYSLLLSNRLDGIEQFIQALMVFEGVDITQETLDEAKEQGVIKLPPTVDGRSGHLYYLNEQLDQSQTQTLVDDVYQTILQIVGMPSQGNANTSDSSNNGAVIMKNGWWNSEARRLETVGMWTASETELVKIAIRISEESNILSNLKVSDVAPKFASNNYEDLITKTQSFSTLVASNCSPLQAFKYSHLGNDPESDAIEYEAYQEEKAQALDMLAVDANGVGGAWGNGNEQFDDDDDDDDDGDDDRHRRRRRRAIDGNHDGIINER